MKILKCIWFILPLVLSISAKANLYDDLSELKKICDAELLNESECSQRKAEILAKDDSDSEEWFCNYGGESVAPRLFSQTDVHNFSETASVSSVVKEILDVAGLAPNFVVRPANVPNASAILRGEQRYIEYNPSFVSQIKSGSQTNWAIYSIMAHEIGHHLQGHTVQAGGSRPSIELEADEYSGFILAKLGSNLADAQIAMKTLGSDTSSGSHPSSNTRLKAIKDGWKKGNSSNTTTSETEQQQSDPLNLPTEDTQTIPPQPTVTYTDSCIVNGEAVLIAANGAILSKYKGFMQVGQKVAPLHPNCLFDMLSTVGRYCVTSSGSVHFGTTVPVGQCQPCNGNICN